MPPQKRVKSALHDRIVGVIATKGELARACRMSHPPDLFELRLDCLFPANDLERQVSKLSAPIIITARHPAEGGENGLPPRARRELLLRFLPCARYVDVELRSVRTLRTVLDRTHRGPIGTIISFHDLGSTPTLNSLRAKAWKAKSLGAATFKVATRTDAAADVGRLVEFVSSAKPSLSISAMGIGKLGAISRILLAQRGSTLVYTSLGERRIEGQMSLEAFRTTLRQNRLG